MSIEYKALKLMKKDCTLAPKRVFRMKALGLNLKQISQLRLLWSLTNEIQRKALYNSFKQENENNNN